MVNTLSYLLSVLLVGACGSPDTPSAALDAPVPISTEQADNAPRKEPAAQDVSSTTDENLQAPEPTSPSSTASTPVLPLESVRFSWCPSKRVEEAYRMDDPADQHRIVFTEGVKSGGRYPVVMAFHGQPARGKDPRDYNFSGTVEGVVSDLVKRGDIQPVILAMPVFRFTGGNWPWFNPKAFAAEVEAHLKQLDLESGDWYLFGHSGAAGCGGEGLNRAHLLKPAAVGFFDTCLGKGWQDQIRELQRRKIPTVNIHSVETAGFNPRQRPEYQADFDFGRAYGPLEILPKPCPEITPGEALRKRHGTGCYATKDQTISSYIIDTGTGQEAHQRILEPAIRFFLIHFAELGVNRTQQPDSE